MTSIIDNDNDMAMDIDDDGDDHIKMIQSIINNNIKGW